jgi:hypothetical protein
VIDPDPAWTPGDDYRLLVETYRNHFRTEDTAPLDAVLAAVATSDWPGDPLWLYVVGPPSSGKTEMLRAFAGLPNAYFLSSLTPNSLISGLRDGKDLLPLLDKKCLIVKDLTQTLEMHRENRDALFGVLRDCFDGFASKAFGTVGTKSYASHFNLVAACTNAVEEYYTVQAVLGQRFLLVRTAFAGAYSADDERDVEEMRAILRDLVDAVVRNRRRLPDRPSIPKALAAEIKALASEVAVLRTHVSRDGHTHEIGTLPEPEGPPRIANQFLKLARGLAAVRCHGEVTPEDLELVRRVARDTVPKLPRLHLEAVAGGVETIDGIATATRLPRRTVERKIEELVLLGAVHEDASGKPYLYRLARDFALLAPPPAAVAVPVSGGDIERAKEHIRVRALADPGRPPTFLARDAALALQLPERMVPELEAYAAGVRREPRP